MLAHWKLNESLMNKLQWNLNQITKIFIEENVFENGVCKLSTIMFRHHCVNEPAASNNEVGYNEVIIGAMASQITSLTIVYSIVYSGADQRRHQSSASLAFVWGIHRWPVNSPHKGPVTRKMFPFDDVIMRLYNVCDILAVTSLRTGFFM